MNVIVTGCYGFIGRKLCLRLLEAGHRVVGIDVNNADVFLSFNNFEFKPFSFLDTNNVDIYHNEKVDILYHLAWCGVSTADKNNPDKQLFNISLSYKVLEFAKKVNVKKIVIPGSISEFSHSRSPITGNENDSPSDLYAATKVAIRKIAYQYCEKNELDLNWLLITSVYGGDRKDNNLITYTINELINDREVLCTKLEQEWDYIFIDDLINALVIIGTYGKKMIIYPIGSGRIEKLSYYVRYIAKFLKKEHLLKIGAIDYKNKYIDNSIVDITKLNLLGFKCEHSFEDNIKNVIEYIEKDQTNEK